MSLVTKINTKSLYNVKQKINFDFLKYFLLTFHFYIDLCNVFSKSNSKFIPLIN